MTDKELWAAGPDDLTEEEWERWLLLDSKVEKAIKLLESLNYDVRYKE